MFKQALNAGFPIDIKQIKIDVATEQMVLNELRAIVSKHSVGTDGNGNHIINDISQFEKIKKLTSLAFSVGISIHTEPNIIFDDNFKPSAITFSESNTVNYEVDITKALGNTPIDETENV
ncbi:hypothetical protein H6P87_00672 [Rickettsia tillamookensis]|uniref:Uncharacterized protein n=1 Tax=Rickettsia tillamookensis TaxID=2761623 RepID=A0A9E6MHK2_9RICK|nr:hypothetical protein [Rickettsia tillamookensis]QQV75126.1 hypothetical protein H6P87_00672 [Rickettsia tillamookensis]